MSAPVLVIRRRNRAGLWGWEITPRAGLHKGEVVIIAPQTQLSSARFVSSTQTRLEGNIEYGELNMAGAVRVAKRNLGYYRVDTGEAVTEAQAVWLSPMGNIFAVGVS